MIPFRCQRSVSTTFGYVLTLAISSLLVTGLIVAGGTFVDEQREQVVQHEMEVVGEHVAGNVQQVDRMVNASDESDPVARINQSFPTHISGTTYNVELAENGGEPKLFLNSTRPELSVSVNVSTQTEVGDSVADGGTIVIRYDDAEGIVIDDA